MTEKRLIDANKVAQDVRENNKDNFFWADWSSKRVCELLESAPTVDAVEVVRCKDCRHHEHHDTLLYCGHTRGMAGSVSPDSFCSYGERRTDA